ncbi:MAG: response regulator [Gammaproteobacteria bacterium]|nr:response regulator [Gammaproteobacteria bacterium]
MASILAVDDSLSMRQMLSITPEADGHDVVAAEDDTTALKLARATAFDLIITDLQMPQMDGITLIGELRKLPELRHKPMFMLTTESADDRKQAGKLAGATGWIVKPAVKASVRRVLAGETGFGA